ncbi:hypothetical protein AUJ95_07705 [Candidatus Desantisbacteria bacterium CG2_30_40_21]|uniref:Uncharacterized protein n=4 Tax=unclassified Candidatus Desantisiibacteriota TaxID=3106372 RepID=A0A2M7JDZ5_9BACT|nr:MAG: hypothetical protein AUJ95_07705 [Candidatus Desantisbacteria bacterium CG2_30_40_21]PIP42203.1 MAG: hypothetical protein COX18_01005 [Candidatus Desantisbacteria bacterium CG23_combo_of_CG06-09_8_20_14_all_40_23]PIX17617.1 MAG: hypothetical protein COZ71_02405 [Candidatus Desantisbacteria bacterium CG_4_8_14_3_um_filter_40_12]PJB30439.1 MAG: hypothetical protein CO110_00450 [Candidatus Desantisbacteria bacterium CG_4_9_14_3_um_filter_40_11]
MWRRDAAPCGKFTKGRDLWVYKINYPITERAQGKPHLKILPDFSTPYPCPYPYPQVQIQLIDNYQLAINNSQLLFNVDKANK